MLPSAPGTFSMTIGWLSALAIRSATMRPTASEELPAPIGTIMVIGRVG
jgi:hypothetical protein